MPAASHPRRTLSVALHALDRRGPGCYFCCMGRGILALVGLLGAIGCQDQRVRVTGGPDTTLDDPQSETAIAVSSTLDYTPSVAVTFNDDTDNEANGYIDYTEGTRTIHPGASLMGWSYSLDKGQSFTYGGKIAPAIEEGWWALWGDPAITTQTGEPENSNVYIGNLAISFRPFIEGGGTISGSVVGEVDGACVASSIDGGVTFEHRQCINHPTCHNCILCPGGVGDNNGQSCLSDDDCPGAYPYCKGDFYDGGSMTGTATGQVFYAVHDVPAGTPHVWRSTISSPQFALLDLPFPESQSFVVHPRLRYDQYRSRVYIAQQYVLGSEISGLAATYFEDGVWAPPTFNIMPGSLNVPIMPTVTTANGPMRTANQFSFDVGETEVRFFFNTRNTENGNLSLRVVSCTPELTGCQVAYAWGQSPPGSVADRFNPIIRVEPTEPFGERWGLQYQTTQFDPGGTVAVLRAVLDSPTAPLTPLTAVPGRDACPTSGTFYWGDYDDLQAVDRDTFGRALFITAFSQSCDGCSKQWAYTAESVHVNATVFP